MAAANIKPTRMELNKIKARLKTARRGHKLLKDKRDELMRRFLQVVRENKELREKVERGLASVMASMAEASRLMSPEILEQSLMYPKQGVEVDIRIKNIMSVSVPEYVFRKK
jgi:V/A-type H+-transporting ATPase subunit D